MVKAFSPALTHKPEFRAEAVRSRGIVIIIPGCRAEVNKFDLGNEYVSKTSPLEPEAKVNVIECDCKVLRVKAARLREFGFLNCETSSR